jgi:hypothetical protein
MRLILLTILALLVLLMAGCKTVNPATGLREFDQIKTEKVRAALKPVVSSVVMGVVAKNPESNLYFDQAASAICEMRDAKEVTPLLFRARLMGIIDRQKDVPLPVRIGFTSLIAIFEINFADRLKADLPPEKFTWNLMDVLCDGVRGGVGSPASQLYGVPNLIFAARLGSRSKQHVG